MHLKIGAMRGLLRYLATAAIMRVFTACDNDEPFSDNSFKIDSSYPSIHSASSAIPASAAIASTSSRRARGVTFWHTTAI